MVKIYRDIIDSQTKDGNVPGIAQSPYWGYEYGPLCGGLIITMPYLFYKKYNDASLFNAHLKEISKYYRFVKKNLNTNYFVLGDWTGSTNHPKTPIKFVIQTYLYLFDKILFEIQI